MDVLEQPPLSAEVEYLWNLYIEIRKGAALIGYMELDSYQRVTGVRLTPFESNLMLEIDILRNQSD